MRHCACFQQVFNKRKFTTFRPICLLESLLFNSSEGENANLATVKFLTSVQLEKIEFYKFKGGRKWFMGCSEKPISLIQYFGNLIYLIIFSLSMEISPEGNSSSRNRHWGA